MALSATFVADFSSFMDATTDAVSAMQGFKETALEMGPAADRSLDESGKHWEQVGRQIARVGTDALAASQTFITAYAEEQEAVERLNTSLAATGQATPAVVAAYAAMATEFQKTTKYADEAIIAAQATLTTIGTVGPDQMQLALTAATNLASFMKIDLQSATLMVAKAFESGGEHLGKLKTLLGEAYVEGMSATEMLEAINQKFAGSAQSDLETYNGKIGQMNNLMSDFNEKVGKVLVDTLSDLLGMFASLPEPVQTFTLAVVAIGTALAPVLVSLAALASLLASPIAAAGLSAALTAVLTLLTGPVGLAIAGVAAVAAFATAIYVNWDKIVTSTQKMVEGLKYWLVDQFTRIVQTLRAPVDMAVALFERMRMAVVGGSIVPDMITGIGKEFGRLDQVMVQPTRDAVAATTGEMGKLLQYQAQVNALYAEYAGTRGGGGAGLQQRAAALAAQVFGGGGGGGSAGGGPVTVNNTFNITGGTEEIARKVSEIVMRTVRAGTQLGTA